MFSYLVIINNYNQIIIKSLQIRLDSLYINNNVFVIINI
jgi:hypothetical protein